ncbi:hypothetical protein ACIQVL_03540 [Streptomyces sp. NPDC090499]|uniref:hypothetical protein n=1 Tax=Streptomyces sp. NPDC090499 TaxID=3365965 RepID=UPI0038078451
MLNRPAAAHAELQDLSDGLEVKAARRWNPALHPRDSKGRFIETGGTVRLWGGQLARVLRALPNNRVLVQDQTRPNEFTGRRHTTLANWVTMVARPDGSAPTDNEDKVQKEDQKRDQDPARGNGVARDDDGDLNTPNDPHDVDDRGRPIGEDDHPAGPRENDDQDEPADGKHPINVQALPNKRHMAGGRFSNTAAVRQHFLGLAERPDTKPKMAQFLRSVAGDDDLRTSADGRLAILRDDETGRWYLTATGTGQRMNMAGDFATPEEAADFATHLNRTAPTEGDRWRTWSGFDFSDPNLDEAASTWRSSNGENIQAAIQRARREFDSSQTPAAPADNGSAPETVSRGDLKPGDRVKVTVNGSDIEWPASTRDQDLPETVTVEGTVAPTYDSSKWMPLLDATLTAPDGTVMTSGDSVRLMRTPNQVVVSGHTDGHTPEKVRADRVRVGDVVAGGEFGHVVTGVRRYPGGRTFTTRNLGGRRETHQFGADAADTMNVIPRARRRPEDVQLDTPGRTQQHPNSTDAKRAAASILDDWAKVNELIEKQWPDGAPEEFQALAQHMQNVTDTPKGADGYHQNAEAMRGALASLDEMDTDSLDRDMVRALHRLEDHLDANVDRFAADARAIAAKKQKATVNDAPPKPDVPEPAASEPLKHAWDNPENLVTLTMPAAVVNHVTEEGTWTTQDPDTRKALEEAKTGKNGTLRVTAPIEVHHMLLEAAVVLSGNGSDAEPNEIRGYHNYAKRVHEADAKLREASAANAPKPPTTEPNSGTGDTARQTPSGVTPSAQSDPGVTLSPDEVNAPAEAAHASKAPSSMDDGEIRDEIVSLMEREMANGGELEGTDRTRLRVLEAEEARRAGRKPPEEPKPKPKTPQEEPGGLFNVDTDEQQRFVADPNNPDDQADDPTGTPDMFAAHEGRDTSRLRPPQSRKPADFQPGDRFVDNDGRTHTVKEPPLRTPRGRIRVVDEDGGEHFLAPDKELRVLHADEDAPAAPEANAPGTNAPEDDGPSADTPDSQTPTVEPSEADTPTPDATGTPAAEPAEAPADQVRIDHSGTGTTVRFPTSNGMVSDEEFAVLRRLGFKGSRDRTQPRFFYLPSNMTLSRRDDKVRQLKQWLDGRGVAYHAPQDEAERPDLTPEQLEQLEQLKGRYHAPPGTWATTDFQPGDEVWTGHRWETIDSLGPKNMRLQGRGATPYDSVLARRRGSEIRTMFDAPADDGTPRPGADDPKTMRDGQIAQELAQLRGAALPEGNEPSARAVRRQVATRIQALTSAQSEREYARRHDESNRRDQARLVRDPERLARLKGEQVQGRDGALIGAVYKDPKTKKWVYVDRDGRTPTRERYTSRAAAITALNKINDARNQRSGEGWKHSGWDDVQPGDTVRVPEIGRPEGTSARTVTTWSEPIEVSEIRRGDMGQVIITGRRNGEDVQLEVDRATASFGTSQPGTVPDRERSDAGGGMDWRQMRPDDFGQDERPTPSPEQNQPRPADEFGTPDLIANGTTDTPQASPDNSQTPATSDTGAIGVDLNHAHYEEPGTPSGREAREERWALMESWNASPLNARLMSEPAESERHRLAAAVQASEADPELDDQMWGLQRRAQQRLRDAADALLANLGEETGNDEDRATLQKLRDATDLHLNRMAVTSEGYTDPLLDRIREARKREEESNRGNSHAPVTPAAPIRDTPPASMEDDDIKAELEELQAWQNRHVAPSGEGPRVQGNAMLAVSPVANRRRALWEEQRKRELVRKNNERKEKEKQDRAAALARAAIGKRSEDGSYPITVDGEHAGSVRQLGRQWLYTRDGEESGPLEHSSRAAAVAALVRNIDVRREMDEARTREAARRAEGEARAAAAAQPDHGPAYSNELRARMADIGDDIATLRNHSEGIDDQDRMQRLAELIRRVEDGHTEDLQGDLRQIRDEAAWLEEQYSNPDLPFETRRTKSWATAALMKAERDLAHPDFQSAAAVTDNGPMPAPNAPGQAADEFAAVRQRYDGDMVPASDIQRGDWVHTVSGDPAYNEPMHMVGRVVGVTPVLSNGQVRVEVESHVTLRGRDHVRTEAAMIDATDLVERLPEGNPGRDDSSDLQRRIEGANGQRIASKVRVPEGWQAVDGSQIQPRPGDRFRIVVGRGGLTDREHVNVTVERPAEREGYWRVKGQPLSFRPSDIVAIPDGTDAHYRDDDAPAAGEPDAEGVPAWADDLGDSVWLDRPKQGAGPRNIYVDGQIEGLLGRDKPQGRYYWWRPGGQTSEGRYDSPEEAARGFAHDMRGQGLPSLSNGNDDAQHRRGRTLQTQLLFNAGMNAVGGESLPEMQELNDRLDRADSADDPDTELRDIADRIDALADQYELAGPQGELAAERFRQAALAARGEHDDRANHGGDDHSTDGESNTGQDDNQATPADDGDDNTGEPNPDDNEGEQRQDQDDEDNSRQRNDTDPDGGPNGGGADAPDSSDDNGNSNNDSDSDHTDDEENAPNPDEENQDDEERRRRRRRRNNGGGTGGPGEGGPGGVGLPHPDLPDFNVPTGDGSNDTAGDHGHDVDSLRNAWRTGEGLTADEDTPERRAHLADLADREGLALSPQGGLALWPEQQDDGTTVWRFAQARNGSGLPGITLTSDDPEEARTLAGRFEELTDANGDPFDWHRPQDRASVAAWRDGESRNLPQAIRAVQDDYQQERAGAFNLPDDLTDVEDADLEAAMRQGLGPEDQLRVMAEMDRRDGYVDQRVRAAAQTTPPANADEAEREGRAMDEALRFGDTDVTQPAPATPGRLRREFDGLDEERFQAATQATGGRMLSPKAEAAGIDPRAVFSGGKYSNKQARELASPELNRWLFGDDKTDGNGRLTYPQYRAREADRVLRAEFADWDEARYQQAVDATNGYLFRREYKYANPGFDERELFSGGSLSARDRWRQYASEELDEWYDLNGGRQTFAQYKEARRANDRAERQQYEEEQRAANAPRFSNVDELRQRLQEGTFDDRGVHNNLWARDNRDELAANRTLELSPGGRLAIARYKGSSGRSSWHVLAPGSMASLYTFTSQPDALRMTQVMEGIRDADGNPFPWDAPDAMDRARAFRGPDGESLGAALARGISEEYADDENHRNHRKFQAGQAVADEGWLNQHYDEWRARQEADGYTIPVAPGEVQGGDELSTIAGTRGDLSPNSARITVADRGAGSYLPENTGGIGLPMGSLGDYSIDRGSSTRIIDPNGNQVSERPQNFQEFRTIDDPVRPRLMRRPRPDELPDVPAAEEPEAPPEPIAGQPAHWARVGDLVQGDMVRMNGAAVNGRPVQRAGYVQTMPQLIDVTRRGRSEQMWRTWVTANPDGTGEAGNVYTSANANAARAEAPDDVVPGSPASGAQASVRAGAVPDQIPADHDGRVLFPGSTVHGTDGREGTVTGAADTSVSVHWSDGDDDPALPATTLTVTDGQRPDGWTADGHRVTTQNVVSDRSGALLGPVDDVDGDNVTIHTADGTVTRSAGDLRVTGQVRDDEPATAPVAGIDDLAAGDLKDGDVIVLDLDGQLVTAAITSPPHRDGDRVTLQYADTTTGEMGEIDVDARAVLPRAQGRDGGAPDLGPDNAPEPNDDLTVHPTPRPVDPVTGPTVDPDLDSSDRNVIGDHADGPDTDPDAHQAAVRITADLPVTPEQASALATQLRATADPSTPEGRAAMRAANRLDEAAGRALPPGLDRPRPSNVGQLADGDLVALPGDANGAPVRVYRVLDVTDAPGGIRSLHLEDSDGRRTHRIEHGAMPAWQLPEPEPEPVTPPDADDTPDTLSTPDEPTMPVAQVRPGSLRRGDVIDAPVSRTGYQLNGHRRLTIISEPQRNGWWMQLTGVDEDGNVHDFGLHNGRAVNVYDRNRPTPALPPAGTPRDPNQTPQADVDRIASDHGRAHAARIIDEAVAGTEPPGDIHALREAIAQRLTPEALTDARQTTRQEGSAALDAAGITGRDRANAQRRLRNTRTQAHNDTVRAALRTINDLEPLNGESNEDLAARARDLLRLIPNQVAGRPVTDPDADPDVTRAVTGHTDDAVNALLQQLQAAGVDPGDAERIARILTQQMAGSRQATARRIARRVATANPDAGRQPGLLARIVAALVRLAKRFGELVKQGARTIAEKYQDSRDRLARLRAFLGRMVRRVRQWPESRRLARLHRAVNLPDTDGESLAARITHWAGLMPEPGRFGQAQRRLTFWRPTTWARLASGRLPDRSDRIQWAPDRAADGGPGLTGLRHMAALRMAGRDVDTDVTRRLSAALGDDFGDDPHVTLQHADDYVAASERRLVNLQAARSSATIPDDPDLDIEITAARSELAAARREYADLRTRYAAAVPDAVAASLADIRDMGPEGNSAIVFGPDTDPDAERAVRGVQRLIPRSWLNTPEARRITAVNGTQGRYEPEGQRVTVADLADEGLGAAGYALGQHFAGRLDDLDAAQRAFWFSRTHTGRPGARRMQRSPWDRLLRRQQTQPETGDTLARSIQSMFSGDWYLDDDLRAFLLGLLATR